MNAGDKTVSVVTLTNVKVTTDHHGLTVYE